MMCYYLFFTIVRTSYDDFMFFARVACQVGEFCELSYPWISLASGLSLAC